MMLKGMKTHCDHLDLESVRLEEEEVHLQFGDLRVNNGV